MHTKFMSESLQGIDHLEEIGTDLRIIKYILPTQPFTLLLQRTRNFRTYKIIKMTGSCNTHFFATSLYICIAPQMNAYTTRYAM
jgi:hypothetical protein